MAEIKNTILKLSEDTEPVVLNNIDLLEVMSATDPEKIAVQRRGISNMGMWIIH